MQFEYLGKYAQGALQSMFAWKFCLPPLLLVSTKKCLQDLSTPVHGVGKVDGRVSSDVLDQLHTPIKVGVNAQDQGSVGYGLNQLSQGDFVSWQEDNGGNASSRTVC